MQVILNQEMTCSVFLRTQALNDQEGVFVDLKASPERASELPEWQAWPAFGLLVQAINRLVGLRTTGCKAVGVTPGGYDSAFVDVALDDPELWWSGDVESAFRSQFAGLDNIKHIAPELTLELCASYGVFPDGREARSTRIWFRGSREQAEAAFPVVLGFLAAQSVMNYESIAIAEAEASLQEAEQSTTGLADLPAEQQSPGSDSAGRQSL